MQSSRPSMELRVRQSRESHDYVESHPSIDEVSLVAEAIPDVGNFNVSTGLVTATDF